MKTTKTLAIISLLSIFGATSLLADCNKTKCNSSMKSEGSKCNMQKCATKHNKMGTSKRDNMALFADLNLTDTQKKSIDEIRASNKEKHAIRLQQHGDIMAASVSKKGFDKAQFIKLSTEKSKERITQRASNMEKMFNILTPKQKEELNKRLHEKR